MTGKNGTEGGVTSEATSSNAEGKAENHQNHPSATQLDEASQEKQGTAAPENITTKDKAVNMRTSGTLGKDQPKQKKRCTGKQGEGEDTRARRRNL